MVHFKPRKTGANGGPKWQQIFTSLKNYILSKLKKKFIRWNVELDDGIFFDIMGTLSVNGTTVAAYSLCFNRHTFSGSCCPLRERRQPSIKCWTSWSLYQVTANIWEVQCPYILCMKLLGVAFLFPYILCERRWGSNSVSLEVFGFSFLYCFIPLIEVEPFTMATFVLQFQNGF